MEPYGDNEAGLDLTLDGVNKRRQRPPSGQVGRASHRCPRLKPSPKIPQTTLTGKVIFIGECKQVRSEPGGNSSNVQRCSWGSRLLLDQTRDSPRPSLPRAISSRHGRRRPLEVTASEHGRGWHRRRGRPALSLCRRPAADGCGRSASSDGQGFGNCRSLAGS